MTPEARMAIESILMVADQPVEASVLAQLLEVPKVEVETACAELADEYAQGGRGFILARVAGGYRFQSHPELAPYVERFVLDGQASRLSNAALETLAIVAYKQPISRMQIAAIRGVNVDGVLRTLQQRGYVDEVSRDPGPGNAVLFGTTSLFLERVGLHSLDDLPPLADFVPGADVVEALEDGLRPEPVTELAAEAAALADAAQAEQTAAEPLATPEVAGEAEAEAGAEADVAGDDAAEADGEEIVDVDASSVEPPVIDLRMEQVGAEARSHQPAEPRSEPEGPGVAPLVADPVIVSTVRHDVDVEAAEPETVVVEEAVDVDEPESPTVPFRSTPGAGTGGADITATEGVDLGEAAGQAPAASPSPLTPDVG